MKFRFRPWELEALTVPECFGMYVQAVIDEHDANQPKDETLAPHLVEEARINQERAIEQATAFGKLSPEDKLRLGQMLYPA